MITAEAGCRNVGACETPYHIGKPDVIAEDAVQHDIKDLPDEVLVFLLGSRYCDTDGLGDFAWV